MLKATRFFTLLLSVSALLWISGCSEEPNNPASEIGNHIERANSYFKQGQFQKSLLEAQNVVKKTPNDAQGYIMMARVYNELGQANNALNILNRTFNGKESPEYLIELGSAYFLKGKSRSLSELLQANPELANTHPEPYYLLAIKNAMRNKQDNLTEENIKKLLDLKPDSIEGQLLYSDYLLGIGNEKGISLLDTLAAKNPNNPNVLFAKAKLAYRSGDLETTEQLLNNTLANLPTTDKITPMRAEALRTLSKLLNEQGRINESLVYERVLTEAFPGAIDIEIQYENAIEAFKNGNTQEATKLLQELLDNHPRHEPSRQLLGVITYSNGDLNKASELFSHVDPETASDVTKQAYALTSIRMNQPERVLELLEHDIKSTDNADILTLYGTAALNTADHAKKGVEALQKALQIDPKRARIHLLLVRHYNQKGMPNEALASIEAALTIDQNDPYIQSAAIAQYTSMNKIEDANKLIENVLKNPSNAISANLLAGDYFFNTENFEPALKHYGKVLSLEPGHIIATMGIARTFVKLQQWADAEKAIIQLINAKANLPIGYSALLSLYQQQNRIDDGLNALEALNKPLGYASIATYYANNQNYQKAKFYQEKAISIDQGNSNLQRLGIEIAFLEIQNDLRNQNIEQARKKMVEAIDQSPDDLNLLILQTQIEIQDKRFSQAENIVNAINDIDKTIALELRGDIHINQGEHAEALNLYKQAWESHPSDSLGRKIYQTYILQNQKQKATDFANQWIKHYPANIMAMNLYSSQLLTQGEYEKAIPWLEKIIAKQPNSAVALNNLAWAYLKAQRPHELTEQTAKKAYELAPDSPEIIDTYGWILFQLNKKELAIPLLEKAYSLNPNNTEIKLHLDTAKSSQQ